MAKTKRAIVLEEQGREEESPAHKKRREQRQRVQELIRYDSFDELEDEFEDEFETFEPIKRKPKKTK